MTSPQKHLANIQNAALSTGPRTSEGKAASSRNSLKHGLTGLMTLLPDEDLDEYAHHCEAIVHDLQPVGGLELHVAQAIADDYWRIQRARRLCQQVENIADSRSDLPDAQKLALYSGYEARITRNLRNNHAELRRLRADRATLAADPAPIEPESIPEPAPSPENSAPESAIDPDLDTDAGFSLEELMARLPPGFVYNPDAPMADNIEYFAAIDDLMEERGLIAPSMRLTKKVPIESQAE